VSVALHAAAVQDAVERVEGSEQGGGAVPLVVVRHRPALTRLDRQAGLRAVERLYRLSRNQAVQGQSPQLRNRRAARGESRSHPHLPHGSATRASRQPPRHQIAQAHADPERGLRQLVSNRPAPRHTARVSSWTVEIVERRSRAAHINDAPSLRLCHPDDRRGKLFTDGKVRL
jgi:hypothetical protein